MAQRRMISRSIAEDDRFVDMQPISKLLYFYLVLNAGDDGFVGSVKMINFLTNAKKENYDELLNNGLILQPSKNGIYVITDWYTQNKIEAKIYKPTTYLSVRALLYIKSDFAYTTNPKEDEVIAPANFWIKNGRDKKTPPEVQSQQYLQQLQKDSKNVPRSVEESSKKVLGQNRVDKNRLDKSRLEQTREDQNSTDQKNQNKSVYTTTSSSNGGMGETTSYTRTENGHSGKQSNNQSDSPKTLIQYINQTMATSIPLDDERLNTMFSDLLNQYKLEYVQQGLINLVENIQGLKGKASASYIERMVTTHLLENIKAITTERTE